MTNLKKKPRRPKAYIFLALASVMAAGVLQGCVSVGNYRCAGVSILAPIIPIGIQVGPCSQAH